MGVHIDKAGRDDPIGGIDDAAGGNVTKLSDRDDPIVLDRDIRARPVGAGAVDDGAALDHNIRVLDGFLHINRLFIMVGRG